jgi:dephospho-CoA kinase
MKIAITGKMCSGKSSLAKLILENDKRYEIFSFGKKVKEVAEDLFNMKEKDRSLLVNIGTKMREIDENVWINYIINQKKDKDYFVIDDLRYQNEYDSLYKNGFNIIQLIVDNKTQEERIKNIYPNNYQDHLNNRNHISERNEFNWKEEPLIIDTTNIKNLEDINDIVKNIINS